jgi:organic radical activating enzyme
MLSKTFCIAPWTHVCINTTGKLTPCCEWKSWSTASADYTQLNEWVHSDEMNNARAKMLAGEKLPECALCYTDEEAGQFSFRQEYNANFSGELPEVSPASIVNFDFKLGNLCNLKCIMCSPLQSSQLQTELHLHKKKFEGIELHRLPTADTKFNWPSSTKFADFMTSIEKQIKWIKITGGEPSISPYIVPILESLPIEDVKVSITTNAAEENPKLEALLSKAKVAQIVISLEGIGTMNDQLRFLSKWDTVEANIKRLSSIPGVDLYVNYQLQCFSISTFIPLMKWAETNGIEINPFRLNTPQYLSINSLTPPQLNKFIEELVALPRTKLIDIVLAMLGTYEFNSELIPQRDKYLSTIDTIRGTTTNQII